MVRVLLILMLSVGLAVDPLHANEPAEFGDELTRILVTFADPAMSNAARAGAARPGYRRGSSGYLVSMGVKRAANRIARDFNLAALDEWPIVSLKVHCLVYGVVPGTNIDDLLLRLRQRPEVDSAQRLNEFELSSTFTANHEKSYAGLQHNIDTLGLTQAHHWSQGDGAEVTIIDTGADFEHPELRSRISSFHDFVEVPDSDFSADAHGTAVAGVIAADSNNGVGIIGVAPSSRLAVLKACWHRQDKPDATCNSFTLAKALDHAIGSDTNIINLSLNGPSDGLLSRLVARALENGVIVVAAAPDDDLSGFPAEIAGVIVVGAEDRSAPAQGLAAPMINAPGVDILVPVPDGGYDFASGTSLSAAQVSGIVALLVARRPDLTSSQVTSLLVNSQSGPDQSVNACRALAELLAETGCRNDAVVSAGR